MGINLVPIHSPTSISMIESTEYFQTSVFMNVVMSISGEDRYTLGKVSVIPNETVFKRSIVTFCGEGHFCAQRITQTMVFEQIN